MSRLFLSRHIETQRPRPGELALTGTTPQSQRRTATVAAVQVRTRFRDGCRRPAWTGIYLLCVRLCRSIKWTLAAMQDCELAMLSRHDYLLAQDRKEVRSPVRCESTGI
eukprot:COSAG01_NODE_11073_length_2013_cov_2.408046_2_plen_109_part_00